MARLEGPPIYEPIAERVAPTAGAGTGPLLVTQRWVQWLGAFRDRVNEAPARHAVPARHPRAGPVPGQLHRADSATGHHEQPPDGHRVVDGWRRGVPAGGSRADREHDRDGAGRDAPGAD